MYVISYIIDFATRSVWCRLVADHAGRMRRAARCGRVAVLSPGLPADWGVRRPVLLEGVDRWRAGISVRSRSRTCHNKRRREPEAEDRPLVATSASAAIWPSGDSPENWPCPQ